MRTSGLCLALLLLISGSASSVVADTPKTQQKCLVGECVDGAPSPADRQSFVGEWFGYGANEHILIRMKINRVGEPSLLALSDWRGRNLVTTVYHLDGLKILGGRFSAVGRDGPVLVDGEASVYLDWGLGRMQVTIDEQGKRRKLEVPLFRGKETSWPKLVVSMFKTKAP